MYLALRDGPRGFGQDSTCPALLRCRSRSALTCLYGPVTLCGLTFQTVPVRGADAHERSYNTGCAVTQPVWALPLSLATTQGIDNFFLFLGVLRCFSSPRSLQLTLVYGLQPYGLPHSEISGSRPVCGSPELIAAYHVLHRHRKPRHPPFALVLFLCESSGTLPK